MKRPVLLLLVSVPVLAAGAVLVARPDAASKGAPMTASSSPASPAASHDRVVKTDEEWKKILTKEQFYVTRKKGTERAFTGPYWDNHAKGTYVCVCCDLPLFDSETKFESGTGWPSFFQPYDPAHVANIEDRSHGMRRVEIRCVRCDAHLGHVFDDGPPPTHQRYCLNSVSMQFVVDGQAITLRS
jgi:peptide-methionine (R)-S-oxide reductase